MSFLKTPKSTGHSSAASSLGLRASLLKSLFQKSIRRGNEFDAMFGVISFLEFAMVDKAKFTNLWNRLTIISWEDCCDIGTLKYVHRQRLLSQSAKTDIDKITPILRATLCMSRSYKLRLISIFNRTFHIVEPQNEKEEMFKKLVSKISKEVDIRKLGKKATNKYSKQEISKANSKVNNDSLKILKCVEKLNKIDKEVYEIILTIRKGYKIDGRTQGAPFEVSLMPYCLLLYYLYYDSIGETDFSYIDEVDLEPYIDYYVNMETFTPSKEVWDQHVSGKKDEMNLLRFSLIGSHVKNIHPMFNNDELIRWSYFYTWNQFNFHMKPFRKIVFTHMRKVETENCGKPVPFFVQDGSKVVKAQPNLTEDKARKIKVADVFKDSFKMERLNTDYVYNDKMPIEITTNNTGKKSKGVWKEYKFQTRKSGYLTVVMDKIEGRPIVDINIDRKDKDRDHWDRLNDDQIVEYFACGVYKFIFGITDFNKFNVMIGLDGKMISFDESEIGNPKLNFTKAQVEDLKRVRRECEKRFEVFFEETTPVLFFGAFDDPKYVTGVIEKMLRVEDIMKEYLGEFNIKKPWWWEEEMVENVIDVLG